MKTENPYFDPNKYVIQTKARFGISPIGAKFKGFKTTIQPKKPKKQPKERWLDKIRRMKSRDR